MIGIISAMYVASDILENLSLAAALTAGADGLTPDLAATASQWTTTKWALALIGLVMLIVGVSLRVHRRLADR